MGSARDPERRLARSDGSVEEQVRHDERRADLLLAEYTALRGEYQTRLTAQVTLVGFVLTIAAAISAVALSSGTTANAQQHQPNRLLLFLLVPLVVNGLGFYYILHNIGRARIASYTRDVIRPEFVRAADTPSWTDHHRSAHKTRKWFMSAVVITANVAIFTTFDTVALILVRQKALSAGLGAEVVWWVDAVFSVGLIAAAATSAIEFGPRIDAPLIGPDVASGAVPVGEITDQHALSRSRVDAPAP
jgi:hypothetical protein